MITKMLNQLRPYIAGEASVLIYFILISVLVIVLHVTFSRIRIVKYIPGTILIIVAIFKLIFNGESSIFRTAPDTLRTVVIFMSTGAVSILFAMILGIMYKRKKPLKKNKKSSSKDADKTNPNVDIQSKEV